ncbi:MAG: DPP IV N-terminal domain-containing protein [Bacteroidetes bacterium]|jgi:dipeptidyl-peptidase-4|nr:DPP IV N-terminal domain-containing protein [Bacteroidota bacterium]MCA6445046.1 DPP IV N-terminal domain-containing protein [Bacteroidota bacterium]
MRNSLLFLSLLSISILSKGQNKSISVKEAVLKGRGALAPKRLQNLNFTANSQHYYYADNSEINILDSKSNQSVKRYNLASINAFLKSNKTDTLTALTPFKVVTPDSLVLLLQKTSLCLNFKSNSFNKVQNNVLLENELADEAPKTKYVAYQKNNNLFINNLKEEIQVSQDGGYNLVYGKSVHRDEFGINKGTFWSTSGNYLAFYRMDQTDVTDYPVIDWTTYPASNKNIKYPMAGNKSHYVSVGVYNVSTKQTTYLKIDGPKDQYLTNIAWSLDEKTIYVVVLNREQNHFNVNAYNPINGDYITTLFEEKDEKYAEPLHSVLFLSNGKQFIWQSRRDGFNHLYLYDVSGKLIAQLTKGNWEVKNVLGFDAKNEQLYFEANEQSPINQDAYKVNLKTKLVTRLTNGNGYHTCVLSPNGEYLLDNFSSCYIPREYYFINANTKKSGLIFKAENPIAEYKTGKWKLQTIPNKTGLALHSRIFLPVDFDSTKKYPVLIYLYNGPHSQMVTNTWMAGGELWYQYMAQKGYIVFTLDGRGTSYRGKAFEQATFRQLGTAEMEDQLAGVDYLKSLPYVDSKRIGVHGWSYGGFMTTSLMTRNPGVFKVGCAGGPVIDWTYYEIMYTERYMDTPKENPEGYKNNNLLNYIDKLNGKLLMIHGAQDDVVVWQHSVLYQRKAVELGVQLDYAIYPGHYHNVLGKDRAHLMEKICNYFTDNL